MKRVISGMIVMMGITSLQAQPLTDYPLFSQITRVQPYTGIVFWTDNSTALTALGNKVQLEFSYMIPSSIVTDSGVYNWTAVEQRLNAAKNRGHQCILRFRDTYPGVSSPSVPSYIRNKPDYTTQLLSVEGQNTYIPDWSHLSYQNFLKEFFTKFSQKYDNDPRLAYMQLGFGSYAEYHLYDGPFQFGQTFPTKAYQESFLKHVDTLFKKTPWSISIDAAEGAITPIAAKPALKNLGFGLFDDSFMHQTHSVNDTEYNRASWLFFDANRFLLRPAGGEFSYYTNYDQNHVLDFPNGPHGRSFESFVNQYHISYMIGNDQYGKQTNARIEQAAKSTGYHLVVKSYKSNGVYTELTIQNTGVAPLYHDAYPALGGQRSSISLKGLYGAEIRTFVISAPIGAEVLKIESDRLVNGQVIEYEAALPGNSLDLFNHEEEVDSGEVFPELRIWPCPVRNTFFLQTPPYLQSFMVKCLNSEGREYLLTRGVGNLQGQMEYDTAALPSGFYILEIRADGELRRIPLIKQ